MFWADARVCLQRSRDNLLTSSLASVGRYEVTKSAFKTLFTVLLLKNTHIPCKQPTTKFFEGSTNENTAEDILSLLSQLALLEVLGCVGLRSARQLGDFPVDF